MPFQDIKSIYMLGIGGIAMGTLATMLKEKGFLVAGSDQNLYPPMSIHLEELEIPVCLGYDARNLSRFSPDMAIIGNVIRRENPEAQFVLGNGLPYVSMPEAIGRFFLSEHDSIVVAGTHGKSTTSSLLGWVLAQGGLDPTVFVGAFLKNWGRSYRLGSGKYMVIEGDEYDTAFFDKGPKFLHYRPHIGMVTSIEYDHADIFPDFDAVLKAFGSFAQLSGPEDYLILNADDAHCMELRRVCRGRALTYGWSENADWRLLDADFKAGCVEFTFLGPGFRDARRMVSRLPGRHNLGNTLAVIAAATLAGLSLERIQEALLAFEGVKRRQDILGESEGILVMEDFAHHPTAVKETLQALRPFYPDRRIIAAFEPRTNSSRRRIFQDAYAEAFDAAHLVCIKEPPGLDAIPPEERMNARELVEHIGMRHKEAHYFEDTDGLLQFLVSHCTSGDLVLSMSNGSFDGLPQRLLAALRERQGKG
jgi:UDP-N-acetylmuramate: L-alanyl-gamma-D-glutamyl-meso-diaminopimelate ligase